MESKAKLNNKIKDHINCMVNDESPPNSAIVSSNIESDIFLKKQLPFFKLVFFNSHQHECPLFKFCKLLQV